MAGGRGKQRTKDKPKTQKPKTRGKSRNTGGKR